FQAEDGIRDFHVTGVQTCALPILPAVDIGLGQGEGQRERVLRVGVVGRCGGRHELLLPNGGGVGCLGRGIRGSLGSLSRLGRLSGLGRLHRIRRGLLPGGGRLDGGGVRVGRGVGRGGSRRGGGGAPAEDEGDGGRGGEQGGQPARPRGPDRGSHPAIVGGALTAITADGSP